MNILSSKAITVLCIVLAMFTLESHSQDLYTIDQILEKAYENSPNIRNYKLQLVRSQESLNAQKAALKSRFSLDVSPFTYSNQRDYSQDFQEWRTYENIGSSGTFRISQPIMATDGTLSLVNRFGFQSSSLNNNEAVSTFSNNVQLQFDQPIFTYNRTKMNTRQLELDLENSLLNYALQKLNVERMVSQYFYRVYQSQQSLIISTEELSNQEKSHEIIKNKVEAGLSAREELWQAELNLANARSSVFNAEVALENAKDQLRQALGMDLDAPVNILANTEVKTININQKEAIEYALKQRLELRQQQINIENSQFNLIKTSANNEFRGNVSLSVGLFGNDKSLTNIYQSPTDNEQVSLSFEIPLWDWGQRKSSIKAAEASLKMSELNFDNEKINIELNIRQTYRNLQNLVYQIEIARKSIENAQLTYQLNLEKYENGDLTSMDLSLYQNQLSSKKNELTNALINYKLELLNLKIQTLWDFETGKSIVPPLYSSEFNN
jgi:outer membrane protein